MVPASTFKYGSIFKQLTEYPESCNNFAIDAEDIPFPSPDITPPVTKTYFRGGKTVSEELRALEDWAGISSIVRPV
jgi:hypothetical protein